MRKRKELPLLEKVMIEDIGSEGNAIARIDNCVLFVPMLIPGDIADIQVRKKRKKYMEGSVVRFHEYSGLRTDPLCTHFGICGGCKWQHLPYDLQLKYKEKQVKDNLERIGKITLPVMGPIKGSPEIYRYRNKLEFTFSDKRWLTRQEIASDNEYANEDAIGFHIPGLFDKVLDIRECHLQPEPSNQIRNAVREYAHKDRLMFFNMREQTGFLRNMIIRNNRRGDFMVIMVFFYEDRKRREGLLDHLAGKFPAIISLMYIINSKKNDSLGDQEPILYKGENHIFEEMAGLKFRIGPKSFSQTNTRQTETLYRTANEFACLKGDETVYDLYTGTGTIACFLAGSSGRVIGIEYVEEAIADAVINAEINGIKNAKFVSGDIRLVLNERFVEENGSPDVIITDPPRAGMHADVVKRILDLEPAKIVYISCNPSTQARDILLLSEKYGVMKVQPVDMFPHTHHVENVILLEKV